MVKVRFPNKFGRFSMFKTQPISGFTQLNYEPVKLLKNKGDSVFMHRPTGLSFAKWHHRVRSAVSFLAKGRKLSVKKLNKDQLQISLV